MEHEMPWEAYCFEFGDAERSVGNFLAEHGYDIKRIETLGGVERMLFEPFVAKAELRKAAKKALQPNGRVLAFHSEPHLAYALAKFMDTLTDKFCYIHISHDRGWHGDYCRYIRKSHFIPQLLYDTNARGSIKRSELNLINVGAFNSIFQSITDRELRNKGLNTLEQVLSMAPEDAYVLVDLSVLAPSEFSTERMERGTLTRQELLDVLGKVKSMKEILGASVVVHGVVEEREGAPVLCIPENDLMLYKQVIDLLTKEAE